MLQSSKGPAYHKWLSSTFTFLYSPIKRLILTTGLFAAYAVHCVVAERECDIEYHSSLIWHLIHSPSPYIAFHLIFCCSLLHFSPFLPLLTYLSPPPKALDIVIKNWTLSISLSVSSRLPLHRSCVYDMTLYYVTPCSCRKSLSIHCVAAWCCSKQPPVYPPVRLNALHVARLCHLLNGEQQ